jgi:DNA replication and repair protein RecF
LCAHIGEEQVVALRYLASTREHPVGGLDEVQLRELLSDLLAHDRPADIRRGLTQHGPHRDDIAITLGGRIARAFGSAGQQRTIALALRLVEAESLRTRLQRDPVLLLDDPFAELDRGRARGILDLLQHLGTGQRILVVPREDDVPPEFTRLERRHIEGGVISDGPP